MNYLLYNPLSNGGKGDAAKKKALKELAGQFPDLVEVDYTTILFDEFAIIHFHFLANIYRLNLFL